MRHRRPGFTLIELVIVVIVIGALVAIAVPKYSRSKENAQVSAMKSDLRNLVTAQELYRSDSATYSPSIAPLPSFRESPGVRVTIDEATRTTWQATATHVATSRTCSIRLGAGERDVEPLCD